MTIRNYGAIGSIEELAEFTERVHGNTFAFDIETGYHGDDREKGAIHRSTAFVVGISFTDSMDWARYAPLGHDVGENLDNYLAAQLFWDLFSTGQGVAHNAGFERRHLSKWFLEQLADDPVRGEQVRASGGYFPIKSDTLVEAYLAAEFQWFGLKYLTKQLFDHTQTELHELFGEDFKVKNRKFIRFNQLELSAKNISYVCEDSVWCLGVHRRYHDKVAGRPLYGVEMAIVTDVLPFMEDEGILYDWTLMRRTADKLRDFRDRFNAEIMADLSDLAGEATAINLASPLQVRKTLYEKLGMRTTVFTDKTRDLDPDKRVMSTSDLALRKLVDKYPVTKKVLQWREQTKLLGTYLDKYEAAYNIAGDGRAHPSHLSAFVITGRFAHSDPNYAQSPKKYHFDLAEAKAAHAAGEEPPPGTCFKFNFRDVIKAPDGWYILGFDLSQAELRAIAGEAQEHALLEAFENNEDVHRLTAALMLGIPVEQITDEQRGVGKTMNFALLYGMSVKGLADRLAIPLEEAQSLMDKYFAGMSAIAAYMDRMVRTGREQGYVESRFGRTLPIWEYQSDNPYIRSKGDRACVNYPIQGCLPRDTRVLTRVGWTPIGDFVDGQEVWTGAEWAPALRLEMGEAPRVRLHLSDGRTFDCDNRHRLLVKSEPWPEWKLVTEAKGLPLCRDAELDWGVADASSPEDWYWVGRFVGDGALFTNSQNRAVWSLAFDGVKEVDDIARCRTWLDSKPFKTAHSKAGYSFDDSAIRSGRGKGVKLSGTTPSAIRFWQDHGIAMGVKAKDLRIPSRVFQLDRVRREAFCLGYLDADGNSKFNGKETYWSKLTSASREGLVEMLRLFQTIGRTGQISKPVVLKGRAAGGKDYVFWDLWLHRKPTDLTIQEIEYLDVEPMYTLSVDHPRHAFSSEGLISKNSATGDYMKIAMVRVVHAIKKAGLADKVKLVMNVHDALEFYVHGSLNPEDVIAVLKPAVVFDVDGWPAMKADWHLAKRWGSPTEIEVHPDGTITAKGAPIEEIVPSIEVDEDGNEIHAMPEVDEQVLHEAAIPLGRQVVVTLTEMPSMQAWAQFREFLAKLPGRNAVRLITPEGSLDMPTSCGLTPAHLGAINQILPGTKVTYIQEHFEGLAEAMSL